MDQIEVPAKFVLAQSTSTVSAVYAIAADHPDRVQFNRLVDGKWLPVTAKAVADQVIPLAKGLIAQGVQPGDRVALMSSTRYEWPLIDYAIWSVGAVTVPIYETSSSGQVDWILQDSSAVLAIIEGPQQQDQFDALGGNLSNVKRVYTIEASEGSPTGGAIAELTAQGVDIPEAQIHERIAATDVDDLATLIYTSGTTGRPKGCELTHRNLLSEVEAVIESPFGQVVTVGNRTLFFLPLAHVLARAISLACYAGGCVVGHYSDTKNIVPQFGVFSPDLILSVPRVFEKVFAGARANAAAGGREKIFDFAASVAIEFSTAMDTGGPSLLLSAKHFVCDKLVYSKLKAALGGNAKIAISGGAPLGARLGHFFRGIGVPIMEGYGLTESTAAITVNTTGAQRVGSVGRPLPGQSVKIADDGEVLLKGSVVFRGYWQNAEATNEAFADGWFRTGDLGAIDDDGYLSITGRKKEIIVTAGGKNVAPSGMEDALRADPLISQAMVVGDQKPFISALVTIDPEVFPGWKAEHGKSADATVADLTDDPDLIAVVDRAVARANAGVSHAESIKKAAILPADFSEETGEMTPTMKVKRNVVAQKYAAEIDALYVK